MSSLLPVLQQNDPRMSMCSMCPKPGNWSEQQIIDDVLEFCADRELPFRFTCVDEYIEATNEVVVRFGCTKLDDRGRCTIYELRPWLCRAFTPGTDAICVFNGLV